MSSRRCASWTASVLAEFQVQQGQGRPRHDSSAAALQITPRTTPGLGLLKKGKAAQQGGNAVDMNKFTLSASVAGDRDADELNASNLLDEADGDAGYQSMSGTGNAGYGTAVQSVSHSVNTSNVQFQSCGDLGAQAGPISFQDIVEHVDIVDLPDYS